MCCAVTASVALPTTSAISIMSDLPIGQVDIAAQQPNRKERMALLPDHREECAASEPMGMEQRGQIAGVTNDDPSVIANSSSAFAGSITEPDTGAHTATQEDDTLSPLHVVRPDAMEPSAPSESVGSSSNNHRMVFSFQAAATLVDVGRTLADNASEDVSIYQARFGSSLSYNRAGEALASYSMAGFTKSICHRSHRW